MPTSSTRLPTRHLEPAELILLAVSPAPEETFALAAAHADSCDTCAPRLASWRRMVKRVSAGSSSRGHTDEFEIAELVDLDRSSPIDDAQLAHLASCASCRAMLAGVLRLVLEPSVREELVKVATPIRGVRAAPRARTPWRYAIGSLAAAAAVLLIVRMIAPASDRNGESDPLRHATIADAASPRLIAPLGAIARLELLRWTSVPQADRYRVTVFNADGSVLWESEVTDTMVSPPSDVTARWSGRHSWRVKARTSFDRWVDSQFGEFTLGTPR